MVGLCRDPASGQHFYVMERVDGFIPALAPTRAFPPTRKPSGACGANVLDKLVELTGSIPRPA